MKTENRGQGTEVKVADHKAQEHKPEDGGQRTEDRGEGQEVREWKFLFNSLSPILYSLYAILSSLISHLSPLSTIRYSLFASLLLLISFTGCGEKTPAPSPPVLSPKIEEFTPPPREEVKKYYYRGEKLPDPFVPLNVQARALAQTELVIPNINSLFLKGVFVAGKEQVSVLTGGGLSYFVRGAKLYDSRNRQIPGFHCIQKKESIIIKSGDVKREINLRE